MRVYKHDYESLNIFNQKNEKKNTKHILNYVHTKIPLQNIKNPIPYHNLQAHSIAFVLCTFKFVYLDIEDTSDKKCLIW